MSKPLDYVIPPIDRKLLLAELNEERFIKNTNKGGNQIFIVSHHNSPNTMMEIGRLRELAFASAGGGTGKPVDIDDFDTSEKSYDQLIVFSPEDQEIVGGYRFINCDKVLPPVDSKIALSTANYFAFTDNFIQNYLPFTIELGRSWVSPNYQPAINPRKSLFALDNIWDGLGGIVLKYPHIKYFFGKVTMYPGYNQEARDAILEFLAFHFPDQEKLITAKEPLNKKSIPSELLADIKTNDFKVGLKSLSNFVRSKGENIPPLMNSYMQLSPTMKSFGTAVNKDFGGVEETAILVTIKDIYPEKKERHMKSS